MKMFQAKIVNDEPPMRSPDPLKIGDLVKLKSGGPMMTVNNLDVSEGRVWCIWFDYSGESMATSYGAQTAIGGGYKYPIAVVNSGGFPPACLDVYEPDNKGD